MPAQLDTTYETLVKGFLEAMNDIGRYGMEKYGAASFEHQLASDSTPTRSLARTTKNEILAHSRLHGTDYQFGVPHDHFNTLKHQLAAAAFNLMMEYYYAQLDDEKEASNGAADSNS